MKNYKNTLYELIKNIGYPDHHAVYKNHQENISGAWISELTLSIRYTPVLQSSGESSTRKAAEQQAAQKMLDKINEAHTNLLIDWEQVKIEAQAGDALIKLTAYLSEQLPSPESKSDWLQVNEADDYLTAIFDRLWAEKHELVSFLGYHLSSKRKATWVESVIWVNHGAGIIKKSATKEFAAVANFLQR